MSAPAPEHPVSLSSSGYEDGLGRRTLVFDRAAGITIERLLLRPELGAFERALNERAARLAGLDDERIARVRSVLRDPDTGALSVDSDFVSGGRLADLIDGLADGCEDGAAAGLDVALGFLLEVLPTLGALHTSGGMAHGAIGPGRTVLTPTGRILLLDALYGEALQRLQFTPARLWAEFGLAMPAAAGPPRLDVVADLTQAGLTALMLALGRPLRRDEFPAGLASALSEVLEIAQIRGSAAFASRLERFLRQILPLAERRPFSAAQDAFNDLRDFADAELGVTACRAALATFSGEAHRAPTERPRESAPAADEASQMRPAIETRLPAAPVFDAIQAPETLPEIEAATPLSEFAFAPEGDRPFKGPVPLDAVEEADPIPLAFEAAPTADAMPATEAADAVATAEPSAPEATAPPEEIAIPAADAVLAFEAAPPVDALPAVEPADAGDTAEPYVPQAAAPPEEIAADAAVAADAVAAAEAEPEVADTAVGRLSKRWKRNRGPRAKRDKLRSNAIPPAPLATPAPVVAPVLPAPAPIHVEAPPPPRPVVPIRMPFAPSPVQAPEPASAYSSERFWEGPTAAPIPIAAARQPVVPASQAPAPPVASAPAPLRIKAQPPAGYAPPAARSTTRASHPDVATLPYVERGRSGRRPSFPWKAAAAVIVLAAGALASRGYLSDGDASAVTAAPKPAPANAARPASPRPAAPATGKIEIASTPSGAKVLIDGAAAGETPLTVPDVAVGRRVVTLVSANGTVRRTVRVQPGKTVSLDIPVYSGFVNIIAPIVLEVAIGGRSIGTTEQGRLLLPPGRHELTLSNADLDYIATHMVEIESGEEFRTKVEPRAGVSFNALPWAEVWIDGKRAGETPIANLSIVLGTHEVVFKNPQFGERRMTTTIKASSPTAISVDFTKPDRR